MTTIIIPTVGANKDGYVRLMRSLIESTPQEADIIVVKNDWKGFATACNQGIRMALNAGEKEAVILINDDVRVFPGWLEALQEAAKPETVGIACDKWMATNRAHHVPFSYVYIKKEVFDKIGVLDEAFKIGEQEDIDFCVRAEDAGYLIAETDKVSHVHRISQTMRQLTPEREEQRKTNRQRLYDKWKDTRWYKILREEVFKE